MFWKRNKRKFRTLVECKTSIADDSLWEDDVVIRHGGIRLCDIIAIHMVKNGAMLDNLICDYEHHCWVLTVKWKDTFFDFYIYNFCGTKTVLLVKLNGERIMTTLPFKLLRKIFSSHPVPRHGNQYIKSGRSPHIFEETGYRFSTV